MPSARSAIVVFAAAGIPGTRPSNSAAIAVASSGSNVKAVLLR